MGSLLAPSRGACPGAPDGLGAGGADGLVGYVTDVEGDIDYWRRYVEFSKVLRRGPSGEVELAAGAHFVFGGDATDQQSGDLQVLRELLRLRRRYPDRVHFVMGNRDCNKLRLRVELGEAHRLALPLREHPGPYWAKHVRPCNKLPEEELDRDSAELRLRWILRDTMGSGNAFEHRREELRRAAGGAEVDDRAVVRSFLEAMGPGGELCEYLRAARPAIRLGAALFVHGGLPRVDGQGWVPGWLPAWEAGVAERRGVPLDEWVEELSRLATTSMAEYAESLASGTPPGADAWSVVGGYLHGQAGAALVQYAMRDMPDGSYQPSIIYNGWLDHSYQPIPVDDPTMEWLRAAGVATIVSGHLPHGDAPLVLRVGEGVDAVTADTSYAANVAWEGKLGEGTNHPHRGSSTVCEVLLGPEPGQGSVRGVLANGDAYEAELQDPLVGRVTADAWRCKGRAGGRLLLCRNDGWDFTNRLADPHEVTFVEAF